MIGLILAAGAGRRLRPHTDTLPKALMAIDDERTILDASLANLAAVELREVVVVVGYAADAVRERQEALERRHGVSLTLVHNDKAEIWNNAYSLWTARDHLQQGALLVNGDTLHPVAVEEALLASSGPGLRIAVDVTKTLAAEEMKVQYDESGHLRRITKMMDPASAQGEYIGASLITAQAAPQLVDSLQATFERDPDLYYEDGYQHLVDHEGTIGVVPIPPDTVWVEVDDHQDLARAREIACRY